VVLITITITITTTTTTIIIIIISDSFPNNETFAILCRQVSRHCSTSPACVCTRCSRTRSASRSSGSYFLACPRQFPPFHSTPAAGVPSGLCEFETESRSRVCRFLPSHPLDLTWICSYSFLRPRIPFPLLLLQILMRYHCGSARLESSLRLYCFKVFAFISWWFAVERLLPTDTVFLLIHMRESCFIRCTISRRLGGGFMFFEHWLIVQDRKTFPFPLSRFRASASSASRNNETPFLHTSTPFFSSLTWTISMYGITSGCALHDRRSSDFKSIIRDTIESKIDRSEHERGEGTIDRDQSWLQARTDSYCFCSTGPGDHREE